MVFSSLTFLFLFLPTVTLSYLISLPRIKVQNTILMLFSLLFYYWGEKDHIFIMLACILVNYTCALQIENSSEHKSRKNYLIASVVTSLGLLFYFKYFNFFLGPVTSFKRIALPLGISFYTFHALSYVVDVYWKKVKAERNLVTFICYVSFFPQLVAGPIVRYRDIQHSFYKRYITRAGLRHGILRFSFGLGKKILIANEVAKIADAIFALPAGELTFPIAWLGAISYALQIYFDFSGYSDMAIGLGLMFGFRYKENFKFPYSAMSIQEFWRKWHISLSSWFRDYVYIPLGGSKKSSTRTYLNLLIIFSLCGLWHGANYTFLVWGLYHGFFLILERTQFGVLLQRLPNFIRHSYLLLTVTIGWVFFRENEIGNAFSYLGSMFSLPSLQLTSIWSYVNVVSLAALLIGSILSLGVNERIKNYLIHHRDKSAILRFRHLTIVCGMIVLLLIVLPLSNNSYNPFLYFRF